MFCSGPADHSIMFEWKASYSVQVSSIDGQHQNLFRLAAKLHSAMATGQSKAILAEILDELMRYTQVHFQQEERMMQQANYPDFVAHKAQHEALLGRVDELQKEYRSGRLTMSIDLLHFLQNWLEKHIMQTDQQYVPYLKEKSVA
jgi:hemerythrin